jgi:transposase
MTQTTTISAGIDVAKDKLDIAIHGQAACWQVPNARQGWQRLAADLVRAKVTRVGIEATGGYERGVIRYLRDNGFKVVLLQPVQVRAFARAQLKRAKNDRLDALLIAAFTALLDLPDREIDQRLLDLAQELTFVEQTEEDIARFKTRLEHLDDPRQRRMVVADIARLKTRRAAELRRLVKLLRVHADLGDRFDLVLSVPGIGERTAIALIVRMPELGRISREGVAALAGVAPFDDDTGVHKGQRHISGGRGRLRRSLYAAALPAAFRWNKALIALYARLIAAGKAHKKALIACARKLLIYANTVVQRGTPWIEKPAAS